jgi:hypothetical protein
MKKTVVLTFSYEEDKVHTLEALFGFDKAIDGQVLGFLQRNDGGEFPRDFFKELEEGTISAELVVATSMAYVQEMVTKSPLSRMAAIAGMLGALSEGRGGRGSFEEFLRGLGGHDCERCEGYDDCRLDIKRPRENGAG